MLVYDKKATRATLTHALCKTQSIGCDDRRPVCEANLLLNPRYLTENVFPTVATVSQA